MILSCITFMFIYDFLYQLAYIDIKFILNCQYCHLYACTKYKFAGKKLYFDQ